MLFRVLRHEKAKAQSSAAVVFDGIALFWAYSAIRSLKVERTHLPALPCVYMEGLRIEFSRKYFPGVEICGGINNNKNYIK